MTSSRLPVAESRRRTPGSAITPSRTSMHRAQVLAGLEQRNDVQDELVPGGGSGEGMAGQLIDSFDVVRRPGERHDVPTAGIGAEPLLDLGHDPQRGEHLLGRPQRARRRRGSPRAPSCARCSAGGSPARPGGSRTTPPARSGAAVRRTPAGPRRQPPGSVGWPAGRPSGPRPSGKRGRVSRRRLAATRRATSNRATRWSSPGDRVSSSATNSGCSDRASSTILRTADEAGVVVESTVRLRPIQAVARSIPRSMCSDWIDIASRVTSLVTCGLPSRSAPIHEPSRMNAGTRGACTAASEPVRAVSARRYTCGSTWKSTSSNTVMAVRTSSNGPGRSARSCAVRQRMSISSSSRRCVSAASEAPSRCVVPAFEELCYPAYSGDDGSATCFSRVRCQDRAELQAGEECLRLRRPMQPSHFVRRPHQPFLSAVDRTGRLPAGPGPGAAPRQR